MKINVHYVYNIVHIAHEQTHDTDHDECTIRLIFNGRFVR